VIRNAGADCASGADATACGRADGSALVLGAADARIGVDGDDIDDTGAARDGAALPDITGDDPPFCSSILIASSGVGMSAT